VETDGREREGWVCLKLQLIDPPSVTCHSPLLAETLIAVCNTSRREVIPSCRSTDSRCLHYSLDFKNQLQASVKSEFSAKDRTARRDSPTSCAVHTGRFVGDKIRPTRRPTQETSADKSVGVWTGSSQKKPQQLTPICRPGIRYVMSPTIIFCSADTSDRSVGPILSPTNRPVWTAH